MSHRKRIIERILDGEPIFPILQAEDGKPEGIIKRWREAGVPDEAIDIAMKMSDNWLKKMME